MARGKRSGRHKRGRSTRETMAKTADRYALYQEAVQDPESDVQLIQRIFRKHYDRAPRLLREDFCGTAAVACEWVSFHKDNRAWGIDLDPDPLKWSYEHNVAALTPEQAKRIKLVQADVRIAEHEKVDVTAAFNFSYFLFKTRTELLDYLVKARSTLQDEGLLFLDLYGGADAQRTMTENRDHEAFDYVWDQDKFDPIHHRAINYIHFEFPDGSKLKRAFAYDWRLWSIPEICDALADAGFSESAAYWEGTDHKTGEGNGIFYKATSAPDDPAWIAYVVGVK